MKDVQSKQHAITQEGEEGEKNENSKYFLQARQAFFASIDYTRLEQWRSLPPLLNRVRPLIWLLKSDNGTGRPNISRPTTHRQTALPQRINRLNIICRIIPVRVGSLYRQFGPAFRHQTTQIVFLHRSRRRQRRRAGVKHLNRGLRRLSNRGKGGYSRFLWRVRGYIPLPLAIQQQGAAIITKY